MIVWGFSTPETVWGSRVSVFKLAKHEIEKKGVT
jgi:hypothetical protein